MHLYVTTPTVTVTARMKMDQEAVVKVTVDPDGEYAVDCDMGGIWIVNPGDVLTRVLSSERPSGRTCL